MSPQSDILQLRELVSELLNRVSDLGEEVRVLQSANNALIVENESLRVENSKLKVRVSELETQLKQNSGNSHKPPSSDGLKKGAALPKAKGGRSGGQKGHKGRTLKMVATPDSIVVHHAATCSCCSRAFSGAEVSWILSEKRQVFDIPAPRMEVTEHQIGMITCCGKVHKGTFPSVVSHPVQYGAQVRALSVLLNVDYKIPFKKIEQLLEDLYGSSFNQSTALSANKACYEALAGIEATIKAKILGSEVVHFDETGLRVAGKLHWAHVAATDDYTHLFVHTQRGKGALLSNDSIIKDFTGWAIHDCWRSYFNVTAAQHGLCNAHILRELEALRQQGTVWAEPMDALLRQMYCDSNKGTVVLSNRADWEAKYQAICTTAAREEPPPTLATAQGKPKNTKGRNLLNRLVQYQDGILAFAFHQAVPFTNNQAERDVRPLKIKQKVAMSFRTMEGAQQHARIQSFVSTLRKHTMNVFQNLTRIFNNQPVAFAHA
jgi:transposase